jgi:hypothetical protein
MPCTCTMVGIQYKGFVDAQPATPYRDIVFGRSGQVMFQPPKPRFQDLGSGISRPRIWRSCLLVPSSGERLSIFRDISSFSCITTSTYFRPPQLPMLRPLGLEHVQMKATTVASGLARHMDSRASSWLPGPENRWHPVPPHLSTAYVPNREPLAYRAGGS